MTEFNEKHIEHMTTVIDSLDKICDSITEPIDSKVLGLLEIARDMIIEQLEVGTYYSWDFKNDSTPTPNELEDWYNNENN